jgi:hypothetical protein
MARLGFVPFGASLTLLIGGLWTYLATMTWGMRHIDCGMGVWLMPRTIDWAPTDLALVFLMWGADDGSHDAAIDPTGGAFCRALPGY